MVINSDICKSFRDDFSYQGNAKVKLSDSSEVETEFETHCSIKFELAGEYKIEIKLQLQLQGFYANKKFKSIKFKTTSEDICIDSNIRLLPNGPDLNDKVINLTLSSDKFELKTHDYEQLKYLIIPLTNLITEFSQEEIEIVGIDPDKFYPHRLINFKYKNNQCWIEPLPDYEDRKKRLDLKEEDCTITSIMVCKFESIPIANGTTESLFNLLYVLGLATGTEIQAPWIEFRDENCNLVKRLHYNICPFPYIKGHIAIKGNDSKMNSGIGKLLEKSLSSSYFGKSYLRASLQLTIHAGNPKQFLSNRKDLLIRELECLCKEYQVDTQILDTDLNNSQKTELNEIINNAVRRIQTIINSASASERDVLNRIKDKIQNATKKEKHFGLAVVGLLNHPDFILQDATIINEYYKTNPRPDGRCFAGVLSYYRGAIIHEGYFNFDNEYICEDVIRFFEHLHDILIRINLKMLKYDGNYRTVVLNKSYNRVDWVTNMTQAEELGYK